MENINELKKKREELIKKLSRTYNEGDKLDIRYDLDQIRIKINELERKERIAKAKAKKNKQEQKVETKPIEKPVEEKKSEGTPDLNRGRVAEPGSTIPDNHKKDDKREEKKEENKKN